MEYVVKTEIPKIVADSFGDDWFRYNMIFKDLDEALAFRDQLRTENIKAECFALVKVNDGGTFEEGNIK